MGLSLSQSAVVHIINLVATLLHCIYMYMYHWSDTEICVNPEKCKSHSTTGACIQIGTFKLQSICKFCLKFARLTEITAIDSVPYSHMKSVTIQDYDYFAH